MDVGGLSDSNICPSNTMWGVEDDPSMDESSSLHVSIPKRRRKGGDKSADPNKPPTIEQLNARRRRLYVCVMKKEIGKAQKARNYNNKEKLSNCKRIATQCMRMVRQRAMQSQKSTKEKIWRAKRLSREMMAYWKKFDRAEKQQKRQLEKEAEEQRKQDVEILEAKRQQRKLNFLITQTELYAHFMASKIGKDAEIKEEEILERLDEKEEVEKSRLAEIDDYNSEEAKAKVKDNATQALNIHRAKNRVYDQDLDESCLELRMSDSAENAGDREQPKIFHGTLKNYQLKVIILNYSGSCSQVAPKALLIKYFIEIKLSFCSISAVK